MSVSSLLQIIQISESQAQKATAANTAINQLEKALADIYQLATSGATTSYTLSYDTTNDLSSRQALRFIYLNIGAGATVAFNVIHPAVNHLFFVKNNSAYSATVKTPSGTGVTIAANGSKLLYCDGVNIIDTTGALANVVTANEPVGIAFQPTPNASETLAQVLLMKAGSFPADFAGSVGKVLTNPTAAFTVTVQQNGATIGTVSISTSGVLTFATTSHLAIACSAGDLITFVAQSTVDATIAGIFISLLYTYTVAQ